MASAIKELLGKEAHELTDEELADLIRGNRPRPAEPRQSKSLNNKKTSSIDGLDLVLDDNDLILDDDDNDDCLPFSLDDSEER